MGLKEPGCRRSRGMTYEEDEDSSQRVFYQVDGGLHFGEVAGGGTVPELRRPMLCLLFKIS